MPEFYTWTILLINQLGEIGEKQLSVFGSRGGKIFPLMHVPFWCVFFKVNNKHQPSTQPSAIYLQYG